MHELDFFPSINIYTLIRKVSNWPRKRARKYAVLVSWLVFQ